MRRPASSISTGLLCQSIFLCRGVRKKMKPPKSAFGIRLLPRRPSWKESDRNFQSLSVLIFYALMLILLPGEVSAQSSFPFPKQTRRELTQEEISRISDELGRPARFWENSGRVIGVSARLSQEQLNYYRERGVSEVFLLGWIAEFGVTPEESDGLRASGVEMAVDSLTKLNVFHEAALADVVVTGKVTGKTGRPEGPYHSTFHVQVDKYLKNCPGLSLPVIDAKLLESGPRFHKGHLVNVDVKWEPDLKKGENVVLLLTPVPLSLIARLHSSAGSAGSEGLLRLEPDFGKIPDLLAFIEDPTLIDPEFLQVFTAYKIVRNKAVKKIRTLHAPSETNVIDLALLKAKIGQMEAVQAPYCRFR